MPRLLLVAHTPSSNTRALAEAVAHGCSNEDLSSIELKITRPLDTNAKDVRWAEGLILGTTENFAYMSGAMKDFFDRIYYPCLEHTQGLPYALFIRAGNDGQGAKESIERIVKGLAWKQVQPPLICKGAWQDRFLGECEELGLTMAAGMEAGVF
jgi:multimeric flavodoxin WrbA